MIQAFLSDAPEEALTNRIGSRRVKGRFEYLDTCTGYVRHVTHDEIADRIG